MHRRATAPFLESDRSYDVSSPFIQVELDALKKAPLLAGALGLPVPTAVGGLVLMWAHVYGEKVETVSTFYLGTFFGVDAKACGEVLRQMGFIEAVGADTWKVKGAGRYTRLSEIRRDAGRKGGVAKASKTVASAKQETPKPALAKSGKSQEEASKPVALASQVSEHRDLASSGNCQATTPENVPIGKQALWQNPEKGWQNLALEPIDLSLRERDLALEDSVASSPTDALGGAPLASSGDEPETRSGPAEMSAESRALFAAAVAGMSAKVAPKPEAPKPELRVIEGGLARGAALPDEAEQPPLSPEDDDAEILRLAEIQRAKSLAKAGDS